MVETFIKRHKVERLRRRRWSGDGRGGWGSFTHDHVLQGMLGEPAVEEHRDEEVDEGRKNHLPGRQEASVGGASPPSSHEPMTGQNLSKGLLLTVIMKGTALIISRMKGTRNTCSQTLP